MAGRAYSRRQLLANAAIAASRMTMPPSKEPEMGLIRLGLQDFLFRRTRILLIRMAPLRRGLSCCWENKGTRQGSARSPYWWHIVTLTVEVALVTTVGGPTRGAPKMIGGRSPPQLCFWLFCLDWLSIAPFTFSVNVVGLEPISKLRAGVDPHKRLTDEQW